MIRIVALEKSHDTREFDCAEDWMVEEEDKAGAADMNDFLRRRALDQAKRGISKTFVVLEADGNQPGRVIAYYSTSAGHLKPVDLPKVVSSSMTIPVIHLLRLAVDKRHQNKKIGRRLLAYFLARAVEVASEIGVYAIVLEPLNDRVRAFYERFGLRPLPDDPGRMFITMKDVRAWQQSRAPE